MPTILTWRLGALGDTVLLLPALAALRAACPAHHIVACGQVEALAPALWSGLADRTLDAADPRFAALAAGHAPAPGTLPDDLDVAVVWSARRADIARGLERAGARRVLAAPALPADHTSVAAHYLSTLAELGVRPVPFQLRAPCDAVERTQAAWSHATREGRDPVVLVHPGAGSPVKRWPLPRYLALAQALRSEGVAVAWTAGPADDDERAALGTAGEGPHLLPCLDVAELAAVLVRAGVVVSGDSGVAHLAALLDVPSVVLFGPTDHITWGPPGERTTVLRLALPCSPCGEVARHCPSRMCLRGLSCEAVHAAVCARLALRGEYPVDSAPRSSVGTVPRLAPCVPAECHPPAPVPGPPGVLPVARWAHGRIWAARPPSAPE
jgi:ADP-heptose:LPS heptosyltransferase